jgi:hypothetical protein
MTVTTLADITTTGSAQQLPAGFARWVAFSVTGSSVSARVGDLNVGAARGVAVVSGAQPLVFPPFADDPGQGYELAEIWVYLASGATMTITYGQ